MSKNNDIIGNLVQIGGAIIREKETQEKAINLALRHRENLRKKIAEKILLLKIQLILEMGHDEYNAFLDNCIVESDGKSIKLIVNNFNDKNLTIQYYNSGIMNLNDKVNCFVPNFNGVAISGKQEFSEFLFNASTGKLEEEEEEIPY